MWYIIAFIVIASFLIGVLYEDKATKKKKQLAAAAEESYIKQYGCSSAEMKQRIQKSPAIKIVANKIKEMPHYENIEVRPEGLLYALNARPIVYFLSLGLSDIPQGCLGVFCSELEKELQTIAPYKYTQDDGHDYLVVDFHKKDVVEGW